MSTSEEPRSKGPKQIEQPLRVHVASGGRFHAFDLARELNRRGYLSRFYTGYPKWRVGGIPGKGVASFPWLIAPMLLLKQRGLQQLGDRLQWFSTEAFDRWVCLRLGLCDVFHFLSSFGLHAQRVAKQRYGALTICDHGSTHILLQDRLVREEFGRWGIPYRPLYDRRIIERELQEYDEADLVIVPSTVAYESFVELGTPEHKLRKLPYGVDLRIFRTVPKVDDVFRVIYVGVLSLQKGIPYLLEAMAPLSRLPRFEVCLVGGVLEDVQRFLRKYEGTFRALGRVPRHQLYRYYSQASVFVIASIQEGLATVQLQAMACGLPVIATTSTGAEDLFADGVEGFIVPIRDPEAIREKVLYLYKHPEVRSEMGKAALRRVQALGGWDTYGALLVETYRAALGKREHDQYPPDAIGG